MSRERLAYAACAWALAFAAIGSTGRPAARRCSTRSGARSNAGRARATLTLVAVGWATNGLKVIAAVLALALVRPFGERLPRRAIAGLLAIGGVLLVLYETAELVQHL